MTTAHDFLAATIDVVVEEDSEARGLFEMLGAEKRSTLLPVAQYTLQIL